MVVARVPEGPIGVKVDRLQMPDVFWVSPHLRRDHTFLDDVECEFISASGGVRSEQASIERWELDRKRNPEQAQVEAERHLGVGASIDEVIKAHREYQATARQEAQDMLELKEWWHEVEDWVAARTSFDRYDDAEEADAAIRMLLRRHFKGDDLDDFSEAIDRGDKRTVAKLVEQLNTSAAKWSRRRRAPKVLELSWGVNECGDIHLVIASVDAAPVVSVTHHRELSTVNKAAAGHQRRRRGHGRQRASRGRSARRCGSRRGASKAAARGGGDPPGGGDDGGDGPGGSGLVALLALLAVLLFGGVQLMQADSGYALSVPRDENGAPEMWRLSAEGADLHPLEVAENLAQEIKLLNYKEKKDHPGAADYAGQRARLEREIGRRIFDFLYPDRVQPHSIDPMEGELLGYAKYVAFDMWEELTECFSDKCFAVNVEILESAERWIGYPGLARLVAMKRQGSNITKAEMEECHRLCSSITEVERGRSDFRSRSKCFNRLRPRRGARGQLVIVIDQVGNPNYVPPFIGRPISAARHGVPRRTKRQRDRRAKATRRRGSRRASSRSAGGGSSGDDPPGESEPPANGGTSHREVAR